MRDIIDRLTSELSGRAEHAVLESVRRRLERAFRDLDRDKRAAKDEAARLVLRVKDLEDRVSQLEREAADRRVEAESLEQRLRDADLGRRRAESRLEEAESPSIDVSGGPDWETLDALKTKAEGPRSLEFCSDLIVEFRRTCAETAIRCYDARLAAWVLGLKPAAITVLMHLACSELTLWRSVYGDHSRGKFRFKHTPITGIPMTEDAKRALGPSPQPRDVVEAMSKGWVAVDGDGYLKTKGE